MLKNLSIFCVAVLSTGQAVHAQGQPVSFYLGKADFLTSGIQGPSQTDVLPANGFVLTDILARAGSDAFIFEQVDPNETTDAKINYVFGNNSTDPTSVHFTTGIPFEGGSSIRIIPSSANLYNITLVGYIPTATAQGIIPAVSTWGLCVLGLFVLIAATLVMARRKVFTF